MSGSGVVPLSDMQGKANRFVFQDQYPLAYAAGLAARRLGCDIVYVDLGTLQFIQQLREQLRGLPVPRVVVGDRHLTGTPGSEEICNSSMRCVESSRVTAVTVLGSRSMSTR
ncbi:MAG: hypothetical protein ACTSPX_03210 [Candidatus Thorarchaeota archaeon]